MLKLIDLVGLRAHGITWTRQYIGVLEREGRFPRRVYLGERRVCWVAHEIEEWIAARMAARRPAVGGQSSADVAANGGQERGQVGGAADPQSAVPNSGINDLHATPRRRVTEG